MRKALAGLTFGLAYLAQARGEAVLQLFNQSWNEISQKMPELAEAGYTALWLPPPSKANSQFSAGYDLVDPFDLGDKDQKGTIATRYGTKDELIRMVQMAHRFGIRVYFDNIMNHRSYDVPGYDANTPITVYPGLLPEDFHLRTTADGFYRQWTDMNDGGGSWQNTWDVQHINFSHLSDLAQEVNVNENFGPTLASTGPKLSFIRQPNNPEYYMDTSLPQIDPGSGSWHPFNGTNGVPVVEDTAAYLIRAAIWFMNESRCDGLRLDAVKHVPSSFFGDDSATPNGYAGAIQVMYDWVHGYGYNNPISGYNESTAASTNAPNNRDSCFDAEKIRNDALIFGEHLGEPPSFDEYTSRGMRLVDAPLINTFEGFTHLIGNPSAGLQGVDQSSYDGYGHFNAANRVMFVQSHDNGFYDPSHRPIELAYMFMREGIPVIYSDGWRKSANCTQCGGEFPRNANASYLGEFGDNKMPDIAYLHNQLARGQSTARWSDNDIVAFERRDNREAGSQIDQNVALFVMNDNFCTSSGGDTCGDVAFDDGVAQNDSGMPSTCYGAPTSRGVGLAVSYPPGSILVQMADSPYKERACPRILVRNVTLNLAAAQASINASNPVDRLVYVGGQFVPPGGGAIEFKIPRGSYLIYAYEGPQASRPASGVMSNNAITFVQNGVEVPRMTVRRSTGPDGDVNYNPLFPFKMRGSVDINGNVIIGSNISNLTYAIDIPVITNSNLFDILVRTDGSATNVLVKLDGGTDLNSQMGLGKLWTNNATGFVDGRDNRPGFTYDMFLGYEDTKFQFLNGPEKFAATNIANDTVVSLGAETYAYTIGGGSSIATGNGGGLAYNGQTANWVYHNPADSVTGGPATQRVPLNPTASDAVTVWVKVGYQFGINTGTVYYSTDGTNPEGAFGQPKAGTTTQVIALQFDHTSAAGGSDTGTVDWWKATIPAQSSGTVKYKIALFKRGASTISNSDQSKYYALRQAAITNFNPQSVRVWLHDDLNTNSTTVGLEPGFHIVRARAFLPRDGKSSVFNTFLQTFYYDPSLPDGAIAFPAAGETAFFSKSYGIVVRADPNVTEVEYNIIDGEAGNDNPAFGNGLTNGLPAFAKATEVSPLPSLSGLYPNFPREYRFSYLGIPSTGSATIKIRLKGLTSAAFTNRVKEITRTIDCSAPALVFEVRCPDLDCFNNDRRNISLDQNSTYTIVTCFDGSLDSNIDKFTIKIDGSVQARRKPDGTPLYYINDAACGSGTHALRYDWGGMSAGPHHIELFYDDTGSNTHLQDSSDVNVTLTGISVDIIQPPNADAQGRSPYTITLPDKTNAVPAERSYTIVTETSTSVTNVLISFNITTNAFAGGVASNDTTFVGTTKRWNFPWTNLFQGTFTIRADALGGGSNTAFRIVNVVFNQTVPTDPNSDDDDNDGLSDSAETTQTPLPGTEAQSWSNGQVHAYFFTGKTDPTNPDSDNDGLPDALELGLEGSIATNTDLNADTNGDGYKNFIADADPPRYNTKPDNGQFSNSNPPPGYSYWNYDENAPRTDLVAGTVTDPNSPDTDFDGLMDGIEDANRNGRMDVGLTNAAGVVTNVIAHPPTVKGSSRYDRTTIISQFPNAVWLETDPSNNDTDGDGALDGAEDANHNGRVDIGLINGSGVITGYVANPPTINFTGMKSRAIDRDALRTQYPNAVWLETDPLNPDTDGDGLPDGWEAAHGLDPWDDGIIGHTNMHTGAIITNTTNGANGDPDGDGFTNLQEFNNRTDPQVRDDIPPPVANSINIGAGPVIGTTGGVTWNEEFQDWTVDDLKALDEYDGAGSLKRGRDVYPWNDGYDWSRDILAFYARDGGADGKYYFRVDFHDLQYQAEQGHLDIYVIISFGIPGDPATANITIPDEVDTKTEMGWKVVVAAYDANNGHVYVKRQSVDTTLDAYQTRGYTPGCTTGDCGFLGSYYRSDLDACEIAISRKALTDAGWNGSSPLYFQVATTRDGTCNSCVSGGPGAGDTPKSGSDFTDTIYDDDIPESDTPTPPNDTLHYWFTTVNQNPINLSAYNANNNIVSVTNRPNVVKLAVLLHGNQSILPASIIQGLVSNAVSRTPTNIVGSLDPGDNPTGYYRALESAQVFKLSLNLHLSGSLISALQWAKSDPSLDPTGSRDGPKFNQRIASMVASGQVALVSGMFADHVAPCFTGSVNRAGIQLQDDIMRTVYGNNSVNANSPVYLAERVADGKTLSDLAANSGHNFTILDQMVHLWWWGEQLYGTFNGRGAALSDDGYRINKFNNMRAFLISGASDQMYLNNDLGASIALRELLIRKALSGNRDQIVVLGDNWETAGGVDGTKRNPDTFNLNLRWIANHPWIKVVTLDKFAAGQVDINNDGTINGPGGDIPTVIDRGSANFNMQSKDFVRHASETNYDNWYYGSAQEESFFNKFPILRPNVTNATWKLGHVLTNGTILASAWANVQAASGTLSNLAKLVYLNGIFETAFHNEDNGGYDRFSTGQYKSPDASFDSLAQFALKPAARATRQASIVAHAAAWAASNPSTSPVADGTQDVDHDGENEYILSNNRIYAVFERIGGRLIAAFARDTVTSNAYQIVGNLVSTPEFEDEREGDVSFSGSTVVAYRTSAFKDWFAVTNTPSGFGTTQYVNDLYTASPAPTGTGWQFTSSDGKIVKTIRSARTRQSSKPVTPSPVRCNS